MNEQQTRDFVELQALTTAYAYAIDHKQWDGLDEVFLPDATIDFTATGGISAKFPEIKQWLAENLKYFVAYMHLMGNFRFEIDEDTAKGEVSCYNPMVLRGLLYFTRKKIEFSLWYHDTYVRTPDGWRIATRKQQLNFAAHRPWWLRLGQSIIAFKNRRA